MQLSVELAAATYHMDIEPWVQAGWRDVTIQVDNDLLTDFLPRRHSGAVSRLTATWRMRRVRAKPVSYTHLDVYKRQVCGCGPACGESAGAGPGGGHCHL